VTTRQRSPEELFAVARTGDRASIARLLSFIERGGAQAREVGRLVFPLSGLAYTVGLTGAPGAGKSTLTSALIGQLRATETTVGVPRDRPTSPFTGGDPRDRVRMQDHATDGGVFIRSMATRGHLGGLALAAPEAMRLLDAVGFPWVLVETVGVGQVEVDVAGKADTTVVVVNPGWGDSVQANKAGLLEVADVFVINKADRPGADGTRRDLEQMLELSTFAGWQPPIITTVASQGKGVDELLSAIERHRAHAETTGVLAERRARRLREELRHVVVARLEQRAQESCRGDTWDDLEEAVVARRLDPWDAADRMLAVGPDDVSTTD
jgi:LAO/AO transport system kinase